MVTIAVLLLLALLAPIWWQSRSQAATVTPFSDVGQVQMAPAALAEGVALDRSRAAARAD